MTPMKTPTIPMSPELLPKQRLNLVTELPGRPNPFDSAVGWNAVPESAMPKRGPRNASYLGQVEWAWGPMNERLDAYYIHRGRKFWVLWIYAYDDNWSVWNWVAVGCVPLGQASEKEAAAPLMLDMFAWQRDDDDLDCFHWINEEGLLDVEEWQAISRAVWPAADLPEPQEN